MPGYARDPVSVRFTAGARKLLDRAYAHPGQWQATRVADPDVRLIAWLAGQGIDPWAPDRPSAESGRGLDAKSRWCRGFVRALYYEHRWYSGRGAGQWRQSRRTSPRTAGALEVEVGRRVLAVGIIPAGRAVRVRIRRGGQSKLKAVKALPDSRRIYDDRGRRAARWSDPDKRDWNIFRD